MNIEISTNHIRLDDKIRQTIIRKFDRLDRLLKPYPNPRLHVNIIRTTGEHHKKGRIFGIDVRLYIRHKVLKAKDTGENILTLCDLAKEQIERQLLKQREIKKASERQTRRTVRNLRGKM